MPVTNTLRRLRPVGAVVVLAAVAVSPRLGLAALVIILLLIQIAGQRTQRRQVEKAAQLRIEQERKHAIFTTVQEGLVLQDASGRIVDWNPATERILGLTGDQLAGRAASDPDWGAIYPDGTPLAPEDHPSTRARMTRRPVVDELIGMTQKDGSTTWVVVNSEPILDETTKDLLGVVISFVDITARQAADERLRANEAAQRASLDSLDQGVLLSAMDGRVLMLNRAGAEILQLDKEELNERITTGRFVTYQESGEPMPPERRPIYHTMTTGQPTRDRIVWWRRASGDLATLRVATEPVRGADGELDGVVTAFHDVTSERAAAEALARAVEQVRASFEHAVTAMALVGLDGQYLSVNTAMCELAGRDRHDVLAHRAADLIHPEDRFVAVASLQRLLSGLAEHVEDELRLVRPDGSIVWGRFVTGLIPAPDGGPGHFRTHVEDITSERVARDDLRRSEARFAALVERSSDVICLLDADGRLRYASPSGTRLLGFDDDAVGRPLAEFVHPDDLQAIHRAYAALLARPNEAAKVDCRLVTVDRGWRYVEIVATNRLDDDNVQGIIANIRDVTERSEAAARLTWQAFHDALTGLANRARLLDRLQHALERARRNGEQTALLFIDLDRFKTINDTLGHATGDRLLIEVAARLTRAVRTSDTVARLGGDEFIVLAENVAGREEITAMAQRIIDVIAEPIVFEESSVSISASIGIALDRDHHPDSLLRDADDALYRAKSRGKNRYEVFDSHLRAEAMRRVHREQVLRRALETPDGIVVHYQPVIDLNSGRLVGAEALLRIRGPHDAFESTEAFIQIAEETGLIVAIGAGVLDDACHQLARWRAQHGTEAPLHVAVNLSARQLSAPGLVDTVTRALARTGLEPADLCLELTESTVIGADGTTSQTVEQLHQLGVTLAIDDFGTGYSSLSYLKRFPVDILKLDRTFVVGLGTDPSDTEIVKAVLSLGRSLGLTTVAEGIETPEQLAELQSLGCDLGQGYLLAPPVAGGQMMEAADRARTRGPAAVLGT